MGADLKELIELEKERNSLLAEISASLRVIANKENQSEDTEKHMENVGKSAFL